tara:strand:- start:1069 stop:1296 length:228 start_codon:yes stop_codon:yes gene_type:complete
MAILRKIFGAIHPTMTFIILLINISLFLGVLSLVNFIQKNHVTWINAVNKKIDDKVDEIKKEIPSMSGQNTGGFY